MQVTPGYPCEVCGGVDACSYSVDGLFMCRRRKGKIAGFFYLGQAKRDPQWGLFRRDEDPLLKKNSSAGLNAQGVKGGEEGVKECPEHAWHWAAVKYKENLTPALKETLATSLGLPAYACDCFPLLGWRKDYRDGSHYLFPMHHPTGECMGLLRRWDDGRPKKIIMGGQQGLFFAACAADQDRPIYVVEGPTDTMALFAMGLQVVGRPGNTQGLLHLIELLSEWPKKSPIVVFGENDAKEDGSWPGRDGAKLLAEGLSQELKRPVYWALPPEGAKDVREWTSGKESPQSERADWWELGRWLEGVITLNEVGGGHAASRDGLVLVSMDSVDEEIAEWLVKGYLSLGELHFFGADSCMGKSMVAMHLAAKLSRGLPAFGLNMPTYEPVHSIFASREDSRGKTVLPRLQAAGADLQHVKLIEGVPNEKGVVTPFSLLEMDRLQRELDRDKRVKLVVIDPVDSYVSATGVDDFRAANLRDRVLDPLQAIATARKIVIMVILHLNKGDGKRASLRLANSSAYYTTPRVGFFAFWEPGSKVNRVLGWSKINSGPIPTSLLYRICLAPPQEVERILRSTRRKMDPQEQLSYSLQLVFADFFGMTDLSPDDCCSAENEEESESFGDVERAAAWSRNFLAHGPKPALEAEQEGNKYLGETYSCKWWRTKILVKKCQGQSKRDGANACWVWCLGDDTPGTSRTPFDAS